MTDRPEPKTGLPGGDFVGFYGLYSERILRFFARRVYDGQVALDLTSETFAAAYLARARFRGKTDPEAEAWIFKIARRQFSRYLRKGAAERRALSRIGIDPPRADAEEIERIEEMASLGDLRAAVAAALDRLSEGQRQAVGLRVVEELSFPEVARRLGISEQTARARVSRGLRALAQALDNPLPSEDSA
jgi:RNA polymerase sigma factor (sigma-70 family)